MMMMDSSSLSIPVPNIISSSPSGGRFDFDDGGVYCGGWQDGKAHGHGVCTGPKNVGEYSGSWNFGFEMSGVYKWKNGAVYEGRWQNGKRHGVGVEYNGKWIYKGEWSQGFKGRYGVKASSNSAVKYEGTWANGLQDGYGSETYSDGGYYQGQMCRGLRHGYGVRKSAPYGDSQLNNPAKNGPQQTNQLGISGSMMIHSNSLQSQNSVEGMVNSDDDGSSPKLEDGFKPNIDRTLASKNGFVLVAKPLDVSLPKQLLGAGDNNRATSGAMGGSRRNSLTNRLMSARIPGNNNNNLHSQPAGGSIFTRGLKKLRKQKSTSDLADAHHLLSSPSYLPNRSQLSSNSSGQIANKADSPTDQLLAQVPFTLSPEELDITDPTTVETYTGEWKQDKRNGHGVCERSDGLRYEGQWHNDMKSGYGVTTFKDGSKEEGKYKNNILIADSKVKRFLHFGSSNMRQRIDDAVKMAHQAQTMALKKAEIADFRAATARDKADQATTAALEADRDSQIAFSVARQYSDSQQQQQQQQLQQQQLGMMNATNSIQFQPQLALAMQDYPTMFGGMPQFMPQQQNALQMRRSSQQQQFNNRFNYDQQQQQQSMMQDQQQQQQQMQEQQQMDGSQQQKQSYLGALEPFNGRRGSFRGGANQPFATGPSGGGGRSSPFSPSMPSSGGGQGANQMHAQKPTNSDPFNDLFDHYKSTAGADSGIGPAGWQGSGMRARNRMLSKQTSLDVAPRGQQFGGAGGQRVPSRHASLHRMSSMDHAEENQQQKSQQQQQQPSSSTALMEQQFKHLVTSGEDSDGKLATGSSPSAATDQQLLNGQTPSGGSSYILPASSQNSSSAAFYAGGGAQGGPTPSPDQTSTSAAPSSMRYSTSTQQPQPYGRQTTTTTRGRFVMQPHQQSYQQQQQQHQQYQPMDASGRQRDVHSLADDQLYMADSRRYYGGGGGVSTEFGGDRSEFTNYDFVISSAPRLTRRVMRRTASLSRNTPIRSISELKYSQQHLNDSTTLGPNSSMSNLRQRSVSPAFSNFLTSDQQQQRDNSTRHQVSAITITEPPPPGEQQSTTANHHIRTDHHPTAPSPTGHLTLESSLSAGSSSLSTAGAHIRKPSLQVRYDPNDLGGLMTREEVAALSHAQREQKRAEAELAESRAKRPLLHLYLTIKEFLIHRKLLLSVLMINICLFEMFANLIV